MNKDRSIVTQAMMKAILPHHPAEDWEQLTKEALRIHDLHAPAQAGGSNSPAPLRELQQGDQVAGFFVEQVKDWGDNVSVKLSGGQLSDGAWVKFYRDEMSDARQLERGNIINCQLKPAKKPGMWFGEKIKAVKPPTMDEVAQGGSDEIPF